MAWTQTVITIQDANGTARPVIVYTDGTNYSFAHPLLDNTGAIIAPATSGNQTAGNASLAAIAAGVSTAANQATEIASLAAIQAALSTRLAPPPLVVAGTPFARPANTTTYTFGDLVANNVTAGSVTPVPIAAARATDLAGTIIRCRLLKSSTSVANAIFRLHLYNVLPTVTNGDNGVWQSTSAGYIGSMDVTIDKQFSDGAEGNGVPTVGSVISFAPVSGTQNIYCLIEARAAYLPASGETFTPILEVA